MTLETTECVLQTLDITYEIVAIDDGSVDSTWRELSKYTMKSPNVRAIRLSRNFGKEAAICAGLSEAIGDAVILMDGDLQHPPRYFPEMIALWREGYEVVEGVNVAINIIYTQIAYLWAVHRNGVICFMQTMNNIY